MRCAKYQHYFATDRWRVLSDMFRLEVFSVHGLSSGSMLQRLMLAGVAALKTRYKFMVVSTPLAQHLMFKC